MRVFLFTGAWSRWKTTWPACVGEALHSRDFAERECGESRGYPEPVRSRAPTLYPWWCRFWRDYTSPSTTFLFVRLKLWAWWMSDLCINVWMVCSAWIAIWWLLVIHANDTLLKCHDGDCKFILESNENVPSTFSKLVISIVSKSLVSWISRLFPIFLNPINSILFNLGFLQKYTCLSTLLSLSNVNTVNSLFA